MHCFLIHLEYESKFPYINYKKINQNRVENLVSVSYSMVALEKVVSLG